MDDWIERILRDVQQPRLRRECDRLEANVVESAETLMRTHQLTADEAYVFVSEHLDELQEEEMLTRFGGAIAAMYLDRWYEGEIE
jgi:CBS-domain-containing membrane protein